MSAVSFGQISLAAILRLRDTLAASVSEDDPEPFTGETGAFCGFTIYTSPAAASDVEGSIPKPITYGPQRKGRGGKIKKWR